MQVELLAQFLLWRGYVSGNDLVRVLECQARRCQAFGVYAVEFKYVSPEQARQINAHQIHHNLRFGEAALALGLLNEKQVRAVLTAQKNDQISLEKAVVELGVMTVDEFAAATLAFMKEQTHFAELAMLVPHQLGDRGAIIRVLEIASKLLLRVWGLKNSFGPVTLEERRFAPSAYNARIRFSGDFVGELLVMAEAPCVHAGGKQLLGTAELMKEECRDIVREYVNVVAGQVAGAMAASGKHVSIAPPESFNSEFPLVRQRAARTTYSTAAGSVEVGVITDS